MEVLACPHCERLFRTPPEALGKKIRCRGCRQIFHVPRDTSQVPLGLAVFWADQTEEIPSVAVECMVDGGDAPRCPKCNRTFRVRADFVGKTTRCRGCKVIFLVRATESRSVASNERPSPAPVARATSAPEAPQRQRPSPAPVAAAPAPSPPPTVFEDIGDALDKLQPGEKVESVTRPKRVPRPPPPANNGLAFTIAVVVGGLCAIPVTVLILEKIAPDIQEEIMKPFPQFLRNILP